MRDAAFNTQLFDSLSDLFFIEIFHTDILIFIAEKVLTYLYYRYIIKISMIQIRRKIYERIKEIYLSDCGPVDKMKNTEEYDRLTDEVSGYYDKLYKILDGDPKKWLDEIWTLESGLEAEWGFMCFRAGIEFGLRLSQELKEGIYKKSLPIDGREEKR